MPYRTEHACRLREPEEFQKRYFRRISSGSIDLIIGRPHGMKKTRAQAIRYPIELWSEKAARQNCKKKGGRFEPASPLRRAEACSMPFRGLSKLAGLPEGLEGYDEEELNDPQTAQGIIDDLEYDYRNAFPEKGRIDYDWLKETRRECLKAIQYLKNKHPKLKVSVELKMKRKSKKRKKPTNITPGTERRITLNDEIYDCYGKYTARGFRLYCRKGD